MMIGRIPLAPRIFIVGALAGVMGCSSSNPNPNPTPDAGTPPDVTSPMDAGDVPPPPPPPPPPDVPSPPDAPTPPDVQPDVPPVTGMTTRVIVDCGTVCVRPLDAIPDSMGRNVFFTAFTPANQAAVFRAAIPAVGMPPATPTLVIEGMGLEGPVGITISNDDATLYVADQSADRDMNVGVGAVFAIAATGGAPRSLDVGTELLHPAAISVTTDGDSLLVSAQQRDAMGDVRRALFRVPRTGGSAMLLTTNLVDPSGVSQSSMGTVLVHDTRRGGSHSATAVVVEGTAVTPLAGDLVAGYPAGLAYGVDGRSALFSGADPNNGGGLLTFAPMGAMPTAPASLSMGMVAPLGLHRARMTDSWAVADESAGPNGAGQIFLVTR